MSPNRSNPTGRFETQESELEQREEGCTAQGCRGGGSESSDGRHAKLRRAGVETSEAPAPFGGKARYCARVAMLKLLPRFLMRGCVTGVESGAPKDVLGKIKQNLLESKQGFRPQRLC